MATAKFLKVFLALAALVIFGVVMEPVHGQLPTADDARGQDKKVVQSPVADAFGDPLPAGAFRRLGTTRLRHGGSITSVAWSPDGQWVASAGAFSDHSVRLWDTDTGKEILQFQKHPAPVHHMTLSPDGTLAISIDNRGVLFVWETATGKVVSQAMVDDSAAAVFAANGKQFATIDKQGRACVLATATGERVRVFSVGGLNAPVTGIAWSKDGKTLAIANTLNKVFLVDTLTVKAQHTLAHADKVECLSFAPDGKTLAAAGKYKAIYLWDASTGQEIRRLEGHLANIKAISWSPDGKTLASASADWSVRLWTVATGQEILKFTRHQAPVVSVAFSPDGKRLASGGTEKDGAVRIWEADSGKEVLTQQGPFGWVVGLTLLDNKTLLTASGDAIMRLWDLDSGKCTGQFPCRQTRGKSNAVTRDGKLLAVGGNDGTIQIFELPKGTLSQQFRAHNGAVQTLAFSPDGARLVTNGKDNKTYVWNVATGQEERQLKHPPEFIHSLDFRGDGKVLCSGSTKGVLRLWDITTGQEIGRLGGHKALIEHVLFSPDGTLLASVSWDFTVRVWDLTTGKEMRVLPLQAGVGYVAAFSPDGKTLATGCGGRKVRLWELATGKQRAVMDGHRGAVASLVFLPDGKTLLSGSSDGTALFWDLAGRGRDGSAPVQDLSAEEFEAAWKLLQGEDVAGAYHALWRLAAAPQQALAKLRKELQPVQQVDPKSIANWIADLEDKKFTVRQNAIAELKKAGDVAWPALKKVLDSQPSLEVQTRVRQLLGNQDDLLPFPERLQMIRALEVLEQLDGPGAHELVLTLAGGAPEAWLTREAKMMAQRKKARG
jgi:WD40 repeat protein